MLALGSLPAVSLAGARSKREAARKLLADGIDPSQQRKHNKLTAAIAARNTFAAIVEEHLQSLGEQPRGAGDNKQNPLAAAGPCGAARQATDRADHTSRGILVIFKKIELSGRRETARRLRAPSAPCCVSPFPALRATNDPTFAL